MVVAAVLILPMLVGLTLLYLDNRSGRLFGFVGILTILVPMSLGFRSSAVPTLAIPSLFSASWGWNSYTLIGVTAFTVLGAISLLFSTSMSRVQRAAVCFAVGSALGITMANSFMALFLYWELLTATVALIVFTDETASREPRIGFRFLITHIVAALTLFFGIMLHFSATGSFALTTPVTGQALFLVGIGAKVAIVPLHFWLPQTYLKVSPVTTVVLSIFTTKAGVVALARILPGFPVVAFLGAAMALFGIAMALRQTQIRPLLTYHILSQLGYMVASIGIGGPLGVNGGLLHMLNHMVYKSLLLMIAASVVLMYGSDALKNQYRKPWWLTAAAVIASCAIVGLPPLNGFVSKGIIKYATAGTPLELILGLASIGTAISFSKFLYFGFIKVKNGKTAPKRLPTTSLVSMGLLTGLTVLLGTASGLVSVLTPYPYTSVYSLEGIRTAWLYGGVGIGLFWLMRGILDPGRHHSHSHIGHNLSGLQKASDMLTMRIGGLESYITQLSNAQYVIASTTMFILLSLVSIALFA